MAHSLDFRKKVLKLRQEENLSIEAAAIRFGVGKASELERKKTRNKPATKINMTALQEDVANHPDSFHYERAQRLGVSASGIRLALLRSKITYKKKHGIILRQIMQSVPYSKRK